MGLPSGGEKYRLLRLVGRGGMGVVYEAWDLRLDRRVALKFLHAQFTEGEENAERLEHEARNAARIEHPNVVRVYGMEMVDGQLVIEMQFIEGAPLHTILAAGKLAPNVAADLLRQFLEALVACHNKGVIHCDLKPGNLLVTPDGHLYLTDFGISHSVRGAGPDIQPGKDTSGQWGTPRYTPPEAWHGDKPDPRWDLYSAGAVIYEVLCGAPFREATTKDVPLRFSRGDLMPSIAERIPTLSPEMSGLVDALTAQEPRKRPKDAQQALAMLRETPEYKQRDADHQAIASIFQGMDAAEQTTKYVSKTLPTAAHPARWALSLLGLAILLVTIGLVYYFGQPTQLKGPAPAPVSVSSKAMVTGIPAPLDTRLVLTNEGVCYAYDDGVHGRELWTLPSGSGDMRLLKDIDEGPGSSNPRNFLRRGPSDFVFAAKTPECGEELWYLLFDYDGSVRDIRQIEDILPGVMDSEAFPIATLQTTVLFDARTLTQGRELWCTNTTTAQTGIVEDITPGPLDSVPGHSRLTVDSSGAYMFAYGPDGMGLSRFDLSSYSVRKIASVDADSAAAELGTGVLVLNNKDAEHGMELWVYDPDQPGIRLLADLWPGTESSGPGGFYAWKGKVLFQARTAEHGLELWITDGTAEGTRELADLNPGEEDSAPYAMVDGGDRVYFRAHDTDHGKEIWMTDGTPEGSGLAADIWKGPSSSDPYNFVVSGTHLFFSARDDIGGEELWMLDLNDPTHTARLVKDLWPGASGSEPISLCWWTPEDGVFIAKTGPGVSQFIRIKWMGTGFELFPVPLPGAKTASTP